MSRLARPITRFLAGDSGTVAVNVAVLLAIIAIVGLAASASISIAVPN